MIEGTVVDQRRAVYWHQRRQERMTPRKLLRESDELMFWLEECMVQRLRVVPGWLMPRLVALLSRADSGLPREMGSERRPEMVMEFMYRAQELLTKTAVVAAPPLEVRWHFLGRLQRNKGKALAPWVACWQSVDRPKLGAEIARRAPGARVLVEVNLADEPQKGGCPPGALAGLVEQLRGDGLEVAGLMTVPPRDADPRRFFATLR